MFSEAISSISSRWRPSSLPHDVGDFGVALRERRGEQIRRLRTGRGSVGCRHLQFLLRARLIRGVPYRPWSAKAGDSACVRPKIWGQIRLCAGGQPRLQLAQGEPLQVGARGFGRTHHRDFDAGRGIDRRDPHRRPIAVNSNSTSPAVVDHVRSRPSGFDHHVVILDAAPETSRPRTGPDQLRARHHRRPRNCARAPCRDRTRTCRCGCRIPRRARGSG